MLKISNRGILIVISGPSGTGKGTICNKLLNDLPNLWMSVSATTRSPRGKEVNGVEYFFYNKEEFEEKIKENKFLEYATVHSNEYYGTPKEEVINKLNKGIDVILEIDINGALQIKNNYEDTLFIFIMPPSMKELKRRLIDRGTESNDKIVERFKKAYQEINEVDKYNYVVVNDDLEEAVLKVKAIIIAEKCKVDRIEELDLNTIEEEIHEELVDLN